MGKAEICGIISYSGPNGEPLACAYAPGHDGAHSWGTLPTYVNGRPAGEVRCLICGAAHDATYPYPPVKGKWGSRSGS